MKIAEYQMVKYFAGFFLTLFLLSSCGGNRHGEELIAEVNGKYLYAEDIKNIILAEMSEKDSIAAVKKYIRTWATDILLHEMAEKNVDNQAEIAMLIENYRRSLLIYEYQLRLVKERVSNSISASEVKAFYANNSNLFVLKSTLIKGLFLKVSNQAPDLNALRSLVQAKNKNLDKIESLSIKNAAKFEYFNEVWHPLVDYLRKSPIRIEQKETFKYQSFFEGRDSTSTYFLVVHDYKLEGELQPIDYVEGKIREILLEQKKNNFLKQFSNELFEDGIKSGKVKLYEKKEN